MAHLGASPDGVIHHNRCGKGVCEIKCSFCYKGALLEDDVNQKNNCLITREGKISLDHGHSCCYQVQAQIFIGNMDSCDFVAWTEKDIHIEHVLPELVGKWFTHPAVSTASETNQLLDKEGGPWCYCQQ